MGYESKKILSLIFLALAIVLSWQAWFAFSSVFASQDAIKKYGEENKRLADIKEKIGQISDFTAKNPEVIEKFNLILPDNDAKPNFISALESMASSSGVLIKKINFPNAGNNQQGANSALKDKGKKNYESEVISLSFNSTYPTFKNFLAAIENSFKIMDVTYFDFKPLENPKEGETTLANLAKTYEFNIKLKTYWQNPDNGESTAVSDEPADFSFVNRKQFINLVSPTNYNIVIDKASELNNPSPF